MSHRILFAASEAHPLIKTGGLGDVAGSLPRALLNAGDDVRLVLPAYRALLDKAKSVRTLVETSVSGKNIRLLQTILPGSRVKVWLIDCPDYFNRPGNPYHDEHGEPWSDNAQRYALFCRAIVMLANDQFGLSWQPDVVHLNDWQTGLVPALLAIQKVRPATVFTIHNLAYQGLFDYATFTSLDLPTEHWHFERLEFHGKFSFIKGGLVFADRISTVSPTYAEEIQTQEFGCGLEGLLQHRKAYLSGILNGIDVKEWNPGTDPYLEQNYNRTRLQARHSNKQALQQEFGLKRSDDSLLMGLVSRLVYQKGVDMLVDVMPQLMRHDLQLVLLGSGETGYETAFEELALTYPGRIGVRIGYDEGLAHRIEAGSDIFLMPSRFEPCGLNQMYSQRYGTLPIVTPVGGLADTVVDTTPESLEAKSATGFVARAVSSEDLLATVGRALETFQQPAVWQQLQRNAMSQDFSWQHSAEQYRGLYENALAQQKMRNSFA
jgi:starch synthase